jgi:hypothetical protein
MDRRTVIAFVVRTVVIALLCALVGWAAGRRGGREERAATPRLPSVTSDVAELALALAGLAPPGFEATAAAPWREHEELVEQLFARAGWRFRWGEEAGEEGDAARLAACRGVERPLEFAALLDLWSDAAFHANRKLRSDALLRLARALDPEPKRDAIRAALLSGGAAEIRFLSADFGTTALDASTGTLLGLALWRIGERVDALSTWEGASIDHPDDARLHLLLGARLVALDPPRPVAARRHLEAARALLPTVARLRAP